jgi:hypothetical protein
MPLNFGGDHTASLIAEGRGCTRDEISVVAETRVLNSTNKLPPLAQPHRTGLYASSKGKYYAKFNKPCRIGPEVKACTNVSILGTQDVDDSCSI